MLETSSADAAIECRKVIVSVPFLQHVMDCNLIGSVGPRAKKASCTDALVQAR